MELRQLEYFEAVSRHSSFTKAANELCVAQPSITVAIRKLEEELGVTLFERNKNKIYLSMEGEVFLQRVNKILVEIQSTIKEMNDLRPDIKKTLSIGVPPFLGSWMLPLIFSGYGEKYKDIKLAIQDAGTHEIIEKLMNDEIDLGLIVLYKSLPMFETLPVSEGELLVLLPENHYLKEYSRVPFELLKNEKFMFRTGTFIYSTVMEECEKYKFKPDIIYSPSQLATLINLVANGIGISFILDDSVAIIKDNPAIITRPLLKPINYKAGIVWKKDKYLSKAARNFIDFLKNAK